MIEQDEQINRTNGGRINPKRLIIGAVFMLAAVAGTSAFITGGIQLATIAASIAPAPATERVVIAIEGMHCTGCSSGIQAMLKRTAGVVSAEVSYEKKEATVEYNPADTSHDKILEVITNLGYKATVKG